MRLLACENLSVRYGGTTAVDQVSFTVNAGDYIAVIGENGAGKTTLLKAVLGLIAPSSGEVRFENGLSQHTLGYLPQATPARDDFPASVQEIVRSGAAGRCGFGGFFSKEQKERVQACLEKLGLLEFRTAPWRSLSGGQKRRVLLARALSADSRLLLLDEPTAGLDPAAAKTLYAEIRALRADGLSILMISHDLDAVLNEADHVLHLARRPLFWGSTADYRKQFDCKCRAAAAGGAR